MFRADDHLNIVFPLFPGTFLRTDWTVVASAVPSILAVIFITVLTTLLTCSGLEAGLDVDCDLDNELRVQGVANLAAGIGGGYIGLVSVGNTMAARALGATGRSVGVLTGIVCLATLIGGIGLVNKVPRFVVGGLQLQIGAEVLWTWCIAGRARMPFAEWLLVVGIVAVAAWLGFLPAVLCGVIGGCVLFALSVSRIEVVRRVYGIDERSSSVVRSEAELAVLAAHGGRAKVIELSGLVFFGSAYQLLDTARAVLITRPRQLILDFTGVTGGDSSAADGIGRLTKLLRRERVHLVLAGLSARMLALLQGAGVLDDAITVTRDRDAALEFAEVHVLEDVAAEGPASISLADWLGRSLGGRDYADRLLPLLERGEFPAGAYVCRQGEPTDSLLFIEHGRVSVMVASGAEERCVRVFGPHTIAGEQGFVLQNPRTASLKVEQDATIWSLSRRTFENLTATQADVVVALLRDIIRVQAERLAFASRQTAVLTR